MNKEAKIFLGVEGASQARSNVASVQGAFGLLLKTLENVKKLGLDTARAITDIKPFDPRRAVQNAEVMRYSVQRLAIDAGASVESLTKRFDQIGEKLGISTQEVTHLAGELGRMTLDPAGSVEALQALGVEANNTNRSLSEMVSIGASLHNDLRVPLEEVGKELFQINRIAKEAGTTGGGKGLQQLLAGLGPEIAKFDTSTGHARARLEAFVALAAGKLPHQQGMAAAGSVLGALSGNAQQIGRYVGRDPFTAEGGIDPSVLFTLWEKIQKTRGKESQLRVMTQLFNGDRRAALNFLGIGSMRNVDDLATGREEAKEAREFGISAPGISISDPRTRQAVTEDKLAGTAAGEAAQIEQERENAERRAGEELLKMKDVHRRRFKGNGAARVAHDTAVSVLPGFVQDIAVGIEAASTTGLAQDVSAGIEAASAAQAGESPAQGSDTANRQLQEQQKMNEILKNLPRAFGAEVRQDPNQLGAEKGRRRPAN